MLADQRDERRACRGDRRRIALTDKPCGLARDYKLGGRLNEPEPVAQGSSEWEFSGCFYAHGNEMRDAVIVLIIGRDAQIVVRPIAAYVAPPARETTFRFRRYVDQDPRPTKAYLGVRVRSP